MNKKIGFQDRPSASARNPGIDLLRGLSILFVVVHHIGLRIPLKNGVLATFLPKWFLAALLYNGYESVFVFFVISGFLITSNAQARWGKLSAIHVRSFYARRASRILPCLFVLVAVLSFFHQLGLQDYVITHANQSLGRAIFSALGLHLNWYEGNKGYLPGGWDVLWSLSIEEVFYLAFPIVCLCLRREWALIPALALLALSLPASHAALSSNEIWQEKAYLPGMAAIATGVLGALAAHRFSPKRRSVLILLQVLGTIGIVAVYCMERQLWAFLKDATLSLLTVSTTCLLLSFYWQHANGEMRARRATAWIRSFGRLSYEIYLTHMFAVFLVIRIFKRCGAGMEWGFLWYFPAVILCWSLGSFFAQYLSLPAERWMRRSFVRSEGERMNLVLNDMSGSSR